MDYRARTAPALNEGRDLLVRISASFGSWAYKFMLAYIAYIIIFTSATFWERPVDAKGRTKNVVIFFNGSQDLLSICTKLKNLLYRYLREHFFDLKLFLRKIKHHIVRCKMSRGIDFWHFQKPQTTPSYLKTTKTSATSPKKLSQTANLQLL